MKCTQPFVDRQGAYPCGQCMPCRFNRRRLWAHRLLLEAAEHDDNSFCTLTYRDAPHTLRPDDLQLWLKRFRDSIKPRRIRFFGVGEYGEKNSRPHFHVAVFGWPPCVSAPLTPRGECQCDPCSVVRKTWGYGHVTCWILEPSSCQYVAKYTVKKMTDRADSRLHEGQHPEFARMSLRPGIGANAMWDVASEMMRYRASDVPHELHYNGRKSLPLGRYLRNKLKEMTGRESGATVEEIASLTRQVQAVREFAFANDRSVSSVFKELNEGLEAKLEAKVNQERRKL